MKARVKATGKIIEIKSKVIASAITGEYLLKYIDLETGVSYFEEELFFPKDLADDPDYWTRLEHQYAGMAMQGILANYGVEPLPDDAANNAYEYAHTLVEKMNEADR